MKKITQSLKATCSLWYHNDADHLAASVSYYSLFGLVPFILLTLAFTSFIFGREVVSGYLMAAGGLLGGDILSLLTDAISNLETMAGKFSIPLLGVVFFSGMTIVMINTFTSGLMHIWSVSHHGFRGWLNKSFRSVLFVVLVQIVVLLMLVVQLAATWLTFLPLWLVTAFVFLGNFILITFLISLAYGTLLWETPSWRARWRGAIVASALFYAAKLLVAFYVSITPFPGLFGAAGLLVVLLIWVYATVSILYFGAALAKVLDR